MAAASSSTLIAIAARSAPSRLQDAPPYVDSIMDDVWTSETERTLLSWREKCTMYRYLHKETAGYFHRWHLFIGLPCVILAAVAGTSAWSSMETNPSVVIEDNTVVDSSPTTWAWLTSITTSLLAILTSVQTFLNMEGRSKAHKHIGDGYGRLSHQITRELTLPKRKRQLASIFLDHVMKEYDRLHESSDLVPDFIWNKWNGLRQQIQMQNASATVGSNSTSITVRRSPANRPAPTTRPPSSSWASASAASAATAAAAAGARDRIEADYPETVVET